MATGDSLRETGEQHELEPGEAMTANGRLSIARRFESVRPRLPFSHSQLTRLDEALTLSTRSTGLEFAIYIGDLGDDTRAAAEQLHANLAPRASEGVLVAVSPGQRQVEVVTGDEAYRRVPDRACKLAVMSMVASFKENDIVGGLISGLRMLADAAGTNFAARSHH